MRRPARSPHVVAAGVAGAVVDCGGGVFALPGGQAFGLGEGVGQVGVHAGEPRGRGMGCAGSG